MSQEKEPLYERLRCIADGNTTLLEQAPPEAKAVFDMAMGKWIRGGYHGFFLSPDSLDGHCEPEDFVTTIVGRLDSLGHAYNGSATQSPIEDMLLGGLLWLHMDWAGFPSFDYLSGPNEEDRPDDNTGLDGRPGVDYWLTPQAEIAGYKADFLLWFRVGKEVGGIVIECDGHAFHEKTKEQAARDKKRDREILKAGYPVLRFTGSEVFKDPLGCVEQVGEILHEILFRVSKDGGLI